MAYAGSQDALLRATLIQHQTWYLPRDVSPILDALRETDLQSQTECYDTLLIVQALPQARPFVIPDGDPAFPVAVRFSAVYIAGFQYGWDETFSHLSSILSSLDPPSQTDDYFAAVAMLARFYGEAIGVYNRSSFEGAYALTWVP